MDRARENLQAARTVLASDSPDRRSQKAQEEREASDCEARRFTRDDGVRVVDLTDRFVEAIEQLLADEQPTTA